MNNRLTVAALCCLLIAGTAAAQSTAATEVPAAELGPDSTEQMFWQSVERLATPEGYRAYLTRYPSGFFEPLARAALNKAESAPSGAATSMQGAALAYFSYEADGSVPFDIGETITGPTPVTVGGLGNRRQLVLPSGKWTVLAAQDEKLVLPSSGTTNPQPIQAVVTTVVFGQFNGRRLVSAFQFRFTGKTSSPATWSGIDGCQRIGSVSLQSPPPMTTGLRDECLRMVYEENPLASKTAPWAIETQKSLLRLGATASGPAVVSVMSFSEPRRGHLGVYRFDWPGFWLGDSGHTSRDWQPEAQGGAKRAFATQLWTWAQGYQRFANQGYVSEAPEGGRGVADFAPTALR